MCVSRSGPGGKSGGGAGSKPLVVLQIKRPRKLKENCTAQLAGVIQPVKKRLPNVIRNL